MNVGVPTETAAGEARVALTPPLAGRLVDRGHDVLVAAGAGAGADWTDADYREAGCRVLETREAVFADADVIVQVRGLGASPEPGDPYRPGQVVIGLLGPHSLDRAALEALAERDVSAFALELVPRTGRAQRMDVLTSMASLGGYKAAVIAAEALPALFPMQMTAAGTVRPADVFVVGAGVAGLQAIATARRLGARVRATDIRPSVAEEVESLGAEFVDLDVDVDQAADESGYARAQSADVYQRQQASMARSVAEADVLVTAAAVPGRPAPELVSGTTIARMDPGSVVVDLGAETGGNCEPTRPGETVEHDGVTVIGPIDLPSTVSHTASQLYATNVFNFLEALLVDGELAVDTTDDVLDATLLTHQGAVRAPHERDGPEGTTDVA